MKAARFVSLRVSMAAAFGMTVIATAGFIGFSTFFATRDFIREGMRARLEDLATLAAAHLDAAAHASIRTRDDETGEAYARVKSYLQEVRGTSPDIRFVYTYRVDAQGTVRFVVDAEDPRSTDVSHVGDVYEEASPMLREVYGAMSSARSEREFVADQWGVWLSGYAPVRDATGGVECGLGIDISAGVVRDYERRYLVSIVVLCLGTGGFILLGGLWYAKRITAPLLLLAEDLGRIRRLELTHRLEVRSIIKEVAIMTEAVQGMKGSLKSFRKYVPADLVADLMEMGQEARLGAEKREITVFFSDIANFAAMSEATPPERLAEELAVYFDGLTRVILQSKGTVDKYIGDAIMAFWGAPRPLGDHAGRACLAAIRCRDWSRALSEERLKKGLMPVVTRIGVNTGPAIVGNIGYDERLNYTALGDMVNLASRLEGLNKHYGTEILIAESTQAQARELVDCRFLDLVAVKGKRIPVRVYEVLGARGTISAAQSALVAGYEEAMSLHLGRRWPAAIAAFERLAAAFPDDLPSQVLLARCRACLETPPPEDWDGGYVMTEK